MKQKILLLSFLFLSLIGYAQPIDWNKKLPADPNVLIGKLPNGITYYLRHNEEPKDRASFFIIRNAGALLENDDQDGLAHFLEHMAFNGTKHFPKKLLMSLVASVKFSDGYCRRLFNLKLPGSGDYAHVYFPPRNIFCGRYRCFSSSYW